jgi:hypothetical protein
MGDIFVVCSVRNIQIMIMVSEVGVIVLALNGVRVDTYAMLLVSCHKSTPDMHLIVINHEGGFVVLLHFSLLAVMFGFSVTFWRCLGYLRVGCFLHLSEEINDLCALLGSFRLFNQISYSTCYTY